MTEHPHVAGSRNVTTRGEPGALAADERRAQGKALRDAVPREAHAGWRPPKDRRDPVDLLVGSNEGRLAGLVPIRFGRMLQSPFAFYRGAAVIMAADLAATRRLRAPGSGVRRCPSAEFRWFCHPGAAGDL